VTVPRGTNADLGLSSLERVTGIGVLEDAASHGDADGYEDQAAEEFASLPGRDAEPVTKLQPDQGQGDADRADGDRGHGEIHVVGAQGEADREIVDAQGESGDQQPPGPLLGRFGRRLMGFARPAADSLRHRVRAGSDQQCGADPVSGVAEGAGKTVAKQETKERHASLEYPEDEANAQPGASIDTCHANADRGGKVGQAERDGNQHQGEHEPNATECDTAPCPADAAGTMVP
jgi:hypothetical protein